MSLQLYGDAAVNRSGTRAEVGQPALTPLMLFTTIKLQRGATLASLTPCHFLHFGLGGFSCTPSLVVFMCLRRVVELELVFFEVLTVANGSVHVDLCSMLASWHHAIALPFDCCKGLGDAFL